MSKSIDKQRNLCYHKDVQKVIAILSSFCYYKMLSNYYKKITNITKITKRFRCQKWCMYYVVAHNKFEILTRTNIRR